jgi:hypothetical protein
MKIAFLAEAIFATVLLGALLSFANPSMLPKHPGYPMDKAVDPVRGQSLANDPGQSNAVGDKALTEAATADTARLKQNLPIKPQDQRNLEKPGAGLLQTVEGPVIKIEPPVKEATKVTTSPL